MADQKLTSLPAETGISSDDVLYVAAGGTTSKKVSNITIADGASVSGNNTGDQVLPTRDSLGIDTDDYPQFAGVNIGHASDTTITRTGAGDLAVEGNAIYRAGGTDVAVTDGGTGASTASDARTNLGIDAIATKKSNLSASAAPSVNDDIDLGYAVGSQWYDTTADKAYVCLDNTDGAAVWTEITATGGGSDPTDGFTLKENAAIKLDPALSADGKYCAIEAEEVTAGTALAYGDVVYYSAADSKWEKTDADAEATAGPVKVGIVVVAAAEDATATVMFRGKIREDDWNWATVGAPVYLDTATAGGMTLTAPSGTDDVVRVVGYVIDSNTISFCPDSFYYVHA